MLTPVFYKDENDNTRVSFRYNGEFLNMDYLVQIERDNLTGKEYVYYHIPNLFDKKCPLPLLKYQCQFYHRPKDMIDTIRAGYGDTIVTGKLGDVSVHRYVDREYGEILRQETLRKYKGVAFAWGLGFTGSRHGDSFYITTEMVTDIFPERKGGSLHPAIFDSEEEAEAAKQQILDKVKELTEEYRPEDNQIDGSFNNCSAPWKTYLEQYGESAVIRAFTRWAASSFKECIRSHEQYGDSYQDGDCIFVTQVLLDKYAHVPESVWNNTDGIITALMNTTIRGRESWGIRSTNHRFTYQKKSLFPKPLKIGDTIDLAVDRNVFIRGIRINGVVAFYYSDDEYNQLIDIKSQPSSLRSALGC